MRRLKFGKFEATIMTEIKKNSAKIQMTDRDELIPVQNEEKLELMEDV